MEYQDQGISFNVLSPVGRIRTTGNVFGMTKPGETPEPFDQAIAMGKSAVFICSQDPHTFTGNILFDEEWSGGMTSRARRDAQPRYRPPRRPDAWPR